jgi:hypothetical protein
MKTSKKNEQRPETQSRVDPRLITEMSSKNGILTIQMDLSKPTKKTYHGHDFFKTREVAVCGKSEELVVEIVAFKRALPVHNFTL